MHAPLAKPSVPCSGSSSATRKPTSVEATVSRITPEQSDSDDVQECHHTSRTDTMNILRDDTHGAGEAQNIRNVLPWKRDIYTSRWYGVLISFFMLAVSILFLFIVGFQAAGLLNAGALLLNPIVITVYVFPILAGVLFLWLLLAVCFSSIWGAVRHVET